MQVLVEDVLVGVVDAERLRRLPLPGAGLPRGGGGREDLLHGGAGEGVRGPGPGGLPGGGGNGFLLAGHGARCGTASRAGRAARGPVLLDTTRRPGYDSGLPPAENGRQNIMGA